MKKGLELPVNMIIVIAIAVLVLVVISAYFATQFGQGSNTIGDTAALQKGCGVWIQSQCTAVASTLTIPGYKITDSTTGTQRDGNLGDACQRLGFSSDALCRPRCGCA